MIRFRFRQSGDSELSSHFLFPFQCRVDLYVFVGITFFNTILLESATYSDVKIGSRFLSRRQLRSHYAEISA